MYYYTKQCEISLDALGITKAKEMWRINNNTSKLNVHYMSLIFMSLQKLRDYVSIAGWKDIILDFINEFCLLSYPSIHPYVYTHVFAYPIRTEKCIQVNVNKISKHTLI